MGCGFSKKKKDEVIDVVDVNNLQIVVAPSHDVVKYNSRELVEVKEGGIVPDILSHKIPMRMEGILLLNENENTWKALSFILDDGKLASYEIKYNENNELIPINTEVDQEIDSLLLKNAYYKYYEDNYETDKKKNRKEKKKTESEETKHNINEPYADENGNLLSILVLTQGNECKSFVLQLPKDEETRNNWLQFIDGHINYYSAQVQTVAAAESAAANAAIESQIEVVSGSNENNEENTDDIIISKDEEETTL